MRRNGGSRAIGVALLVLLIAALTFTGAQADEIGCSYFAVATVGTDGLAPPSPTPLVRTEVDSGTAGCGDAFACPIGCDVVVDFLMTGVGLISGEVELIQHDLPTLTVRTVARATCGPSLAVPRGFCAGTLVANDLPGATPDPGYLLVCRADGVVGLQVNGTCVGEVTE